MENETITVNGIEYKPITKEAKKVPKHGSRVSGLMIIASCLSGMYAYNFYGGSKYMRKLNPEISIVDEYELIQQKKSLLSKWERDAVVHVFERNYEKVGG